MADEEIHVSVRAEFQDLFDAIKKSQDSIANMATGVKSSLSSTEAAIQKFTKAASVMLAVLGGGKIFGDAINEAKEFTKESLSLSKQLGISATEASYLAMGIDDVGGTTDDLVTASRGLTRQLKSNEDAVAGLGVKTRDSQGNLRTLKDIMLDAVKAVNEHTLGTDRNLAAQAAFGRGVTGTSSVLKLSEKGMSDSREQADRLNLVVGKQSVAAYEAYRVAMDDASDTVQAVKKSVGSVLMPVLTELANWFSAIGPAAVVTFRGVLGGLVTPFWALVTVVKVLWDYLSGLAKAMLGVFQGFNSAISGLVEGLRTGDFSNLADALKGTWTSLGKNYGDTVDKMVSDTKEGASKIWQLFANEDAVDDPKKGKSYVATDKQAAAAALAARQRLEADLYKMKLDGIKKSLEESDRLLKDEVALDEDALDHKKSMLLGELDAKRIQLAALADAGEVSRSDELAGLKKLEEMKYKIEIMGLDKRAASQNLTAIERQKASEKLEALAQKHSNEMLEISGRELAETSAMARDAADFKKTLLLNGLDAQRAALADKVANDEISFEQELVSLRQIEDARLAIESAGLAERASNEKLSALERQQARELDVLLHQQHANAIAAIDARQRAASTSKWKELNKSIESGMQQTIAAFLKGTLSIKGLLQGLVSAVLDSIANMVAKIIAQWIAMKIQQLIISKTAGVSEVAVNASIAATAAMASVAAIPVYGWAMAPGVGATTYAAAMAYEATAAGGYDIPANVNPITQLHAREMVLPANLADSVRNMAGKGGAQSSGQAVTLNINTLDSASFSSYLRNGGTRQIAEALSRKNR